MVEKAAGTTLLGIVGILSEPRSITVAGILRCRAFSSHGLRLRFNWAGRG